RPQIGREVARASAGRLRRAFGWWPLELARGLQASNSSGTTAPKERPGDSRRAGGLMAAPQLER
ncbi:MAG: hypothetical protein WBZ07_04905, partial [Candidatus Dormiibacterota bacterium]